MKNLAIFLTVYFSAGVLVSLLFVLIDYLFAKTRDSFGEVREFEEDDSRNEFYLLNVLFWPFSFGFLSQGIRDLRRMIEIKRDWEALQRVKSLREKNKNG